MQDEAQILRAKYKRIFNTDDGKDVLADLEKLAMRNGITKDDPDMHRALYGFAQLNLIDHIKKKLKVGGEDE